jgi:hypothetical protein
VYWKALSAVPLLYIDDIRIFPPQINDGYSYLPSGTIRPDPEVRALERRALDPLGKTGRNMC